MDLVLNRKVTSERNKDGLNHLLQNRDVLRFFLFDKRKLIF